MITNDENKFRSHQPQEWSEQMMTTDDQQCSTIMNNDISRMGKGLQITKKILAKIMLFHVKSISETCAFEFLIIVTPE